ncbi:MAG: hypothetical protein RPU32_12545 [Candidatus Sedimenticola sp. (ex Thyasira tokunagai)]
MKLSGSWAACLNWGVTKIKEDPSLVVKIHTVRAGEPNGRVVAEMTNDGLRLIDDGRYIHRKKLGV